MSSAAYTYKHQQAERHVSLTKLTVLLANLAMWATAIASLVIIAR